MRDREKVDYKQSSSPISAMRCQGKGCKEKYPEIVKLKLRWLVKGRNRELLCT